MNLGEHLALRPQTPAVLTWGFCCAANVVTASEAREPDVRRDSSNRLFEFFSNPVPTPGGDPSGHGEGAVFLGRVTPNGLGKFNATLPPVPKGTLISATATDANGNTSEFAANIAAT